MLEFPYVLVLYPGVFPELCGFALELDECVRGESDHGPGY